MGVTKAASFWVRQLRCKDWINSQVWQFILRHKSCPLVPHARVHIPGAWERAEIAQGLGSFWQLKASRRGPGSRWVHPAHLPLHLCRCSPGTPDLISARAGSTSMWPRPFLFFSHSTCRIYSDLAWTWMSPVGPKQVLKAVCSPVSYQVSAKFHCSPVSPGASQRHRSRHRFFQFQFTLNACNSDSSIQGFSSRLLGSWIMVDCTGGLILEPRALRQISFMVVWLPLSILWIR